MKPQNLSYFRKDFPIFSKEFKGKKLIYLDSAATTQKPKLVISRMSEFYEKFNANVHRGVYGLSEKASEIYDNSRKVIAGFIGASDNEIVFTKGATESLNLLSYTIQSLIPSGKDEILLTELEHHSNLVPWQQFAKRNNLKLVFIKIKDDFSLDMEDAKRKISDKTAVFSFTHVSNSLGSVLPVEELCKLAKSFGAISVIDASQSVPHFKINVKKLNCDFLVFSGHKMLGPMGIGVLYGKKELLEKLIPFNFGGDMINKVSYDSADWAEVPSKFEAGTQNVAGASGLAEAVKYLNQIGMENIFSYVRELNDYLLNKLSQIKQVEIYNDLRSHSGIVSFNIKGVHPHDVASFLDDFGICIRAGHHCAMPLMNKLNLSGTCRVSLYFYNTFEEIDFFINKLNECIKYFSK